MRTVEQSRIDHSNRETNGCAYALAKQGGKSPVGKVLLHIQVTNSELEEEEER